MSDPLVSVIVTCYNQQDCIQNSIDSVTGQTYKNLECLVVDDGSSDQSASMVRKLSEKDDRIRLISKPNGGVASARNAGFREAKGEFIQFLDGDDTLEKEKLELQVAHLRSDPSIGVSFTNHRHYFVARDHYDTFTFEPIGEYPLGQFLSGWHAGVSLPIHAMLQRRTIWSGDELPYPEDYPGRCEDWIALVLVAAKGVKFKYIDKVLCTYWMYDESFTGDVGKSCIAAIRAAQYLEGKIPQEHRSGFVDGVITRSLERYHNAKKPDVLYASGNWQLGNALTKPFVLVQRALKRIIHLRS